MKRISFKFFVLIIALLTFAAMLCGCSTQEDVYFSSAEDDFTLEIVSDYTSDVSSVSSISEKDNTFTGKKENTSSNSQRKKKTIDKNGSYTSPEEVAEYIRTYKKLPGNFITKSDAEDLGWVSSKGNLWKVTDHKSIGGDVFGNREGKLPKKKDRKWYECDVNYNGGFRGEERIVYSNDGLIYYTNNHYKSFKLME